MFCKSCGNKTNESSKFCTSCGAVIGKVAPKIEENKSPITEAAIPFNKPIEPVIEKSKDIVQPAINPVAEQKPIFGTTSPASPLQPENINKNPIPAELFSLIMNYCSKGNLTEPEIRLLQNEATYSKIEWGRIQSIIDIELEKIKKEKKRQRRKRLISNLLFLLTFLFFVSLFGFYFYAKKYWNKDYFWVVWEWVENKDIDENNPSLALVPEQLTEYATPDFSDYFVSTIYSSWDVQNLKVENLYDSSNETAWVEGSPGNGVGEYITLTFSPGKFPANKKTVFLKGIRLYNGFCKSDAGVWLSYSRVKKILIYKNEKLQWDYPVIDTYSEQTVLFKTIRTDKIEINPGDVIKIKIAEVYPGKRYTMATAISELIPVLEY